LLRVQRQARHGDSDDDKSADSHTGLESDSTEVLPPSPMLVGAVTSHQPQVLGCSITDRQDVRGLLRLAIVWPAGLPVVRTNLPDGQVVHRGESDETYVASDVGGG